MWTPKRIVLLAGWFGVFVTVYVGFAYFLGGIDGLVPLPARFAPLPDDGTEIAATERPETSADRKLRQAFGEDSPEGKCRVKLEIEARGLVLAAQENEVLPDGRLKLWPFSVAVFSEKKAQTSFPEITTVKGKVALLTFDRPLKKITEIGNRKIIAAELIDDITIKNNRGTIRTDDDAVMDTQGPIYYAIATETTPDRIWTDKPVRLTNGHHDEPGKKVVPPSTFIGTGMDMYLASGSPKPAPGAKIAKAKTQSVGGLDRVCLRSEVTMNLFSDSNDGLFGPSKADAPPGKGGAKPAKAPADGEQSQIIIKTRGPFTYDFKTDRAVFETSKIVGPNLVTVQRFNEADGKKDELDCDRLDIQFSRNNSTPGAATADQAQKLAIESLRATGTDVNLTSEAEDLNAHGNEFTHDQERKVSVLRGNPVKALDKGNKIEAPELQMFNVPGAQNAVASGPGSMKLYDKEKKTWPIEALWTKQLTYAKEGAGNLLTLKGNAAFIDTVQKQELRAETLKVLLAPSGTSDGAEQKPKPMRVDALGRVQSVGPDMHIHDTDTLVMYFRDAPVVSGVLPAPGSSVVAPAGADLSPNASGPAATAPPNQGALPAASAPGAGKAPEKPSGGAFAMPGITGAGSNEPGKKQRPIDLTARTIHAHILRTGEKNDLEEVWCEGNVQVLQDPANPGEKGTDIRGNTLTLTHKLMGNVMTVNGANAQVQMDSLFILGPDITIDQINNCVIVQGMGIMRMPCKSSLDGAPLAKPTEMTVKWDKKMFFDGLLATYLGDVQGEQDTGTLRCQELQVTLDRRVSLKEGDHGKQPAQVEKLVAQHDTAVQDKKLLNGNGPLISLSRIQTPLLSVDNDLEKKDSRIQAEGPGIVRIWDKGDQNNGMDANKSPTKPNNAQLTANNKKNGPDGQARHHRQQRNSSSRSLNTTAR